MIKTKDVIYCFLPIILAIGIGASHMDAQPKKILSENEKEAILEKKLENSVSLTIKEGEVSKLLSQLMSKFDIKIRIHQSAKDAGLDKSDLISFDFQQTRLRTALDLFLEPYECTYHIKDDILVLLTKDEATNNLRVKMYPCRDILKMIEDTDPELKQLNKNSDKQKKVFSAETRYELTFLIENTVNPESWESTEGFGTQRILNGVLIVNQTEIVHAKIGKLLENLRKNLTAKR